jgi:hypothetical protein
MYHSLFLRRNMDDDSNCEAGIISFPNGQIRGQTARGLYEIALREEFAKMNKLTRKITLSSRIQTRAAEKSLVNSLESTLLWE